MLRLCSVIQVTIMGIWFRVYGLGFRGLGFRAAI